MIFVPTKVGGIGRLRRPCDRLVGFDMIMNVKICIICLSSDLDYPGRPMYKFQFPYEQQLSSLRNIPLHVICRKKKTKLTLIWDYSHVAITALSGF